MLFILKQVILLLKKGIAGLSLPNNDALLALYYSSINGWTDTQSTTITQKFIYLLGRPVTNMPTMGVQPIPI